MAWWYEKYRKEQSPADQRRYSEAEQLARQQKVGLWQDPNRPHPGTGATVVADIGLPNF